MLTFLFQDYDKYSTGERSETPCKSISRPMSMVSLMLTGMPSPSKHDKARRQPRKKAPSRRRVGWLVSAISRDRIERCPKVLWCRDLSDHFQDLYVVARTVVMFLRHILEIEKDKEAYKRKEFRTDTSPA